MVYGIRLLINEFKGKKVRDRQALHNAAQICFLILNCVIACIVLIALCVH